MIVSYFPDNQALANLAIRMFDNYEFNCLHITTEVEYERELDRQRNTVSGFNAILKSHQIDGRIAEVLHNGAINFQYQSGSRFVAIDTMIAILKELALDGLLWPNSNDPGEMGFKFGVIININTDLTRYSSRVRLIPIYERYNISDVTVMKVGK